MHAQLDWGEMQFLIATFTNDFFPRHLFPLRRRFARLKDQIWKKTCKIRLGNGLLNAGWSPNKLSPLTPMNDQGRVSPLLDISIIHSWNSCALVWTLFGNPVSITVTLALLKRGLWTLEIIVNLQVLHEIMKMADLTKSYQTKWMFMNLMILLNFSQICRGKISFTGLMILTNF